MRPAADGEHRPEAIGELEAVARQILAPDFDGDTREAIVAALEQVATSHGDRLAHWFMDLWLDAEAHDCLSNSRGCYLCQIIRAQREGRRQ
jgi:hypothetical protein